MSRTLRPFALALLLLAASGCYTSRYVVPSEHPSDSYEFVDSFEVQKRSSWVIFGLIPVIEADVEAVVDREVRRVEGDAATNVVVTAQYDAVDVVVGIVVGGLFNTRSYTVEGDVVRFSGATAARPSDGPRRTILGEVRYRAEPAAPAAAAP